MFRLSLFAALGLFSVLLLTLSTNRTEAVGFVSLHQSGPAVDAFWEFDNGDGSITFVSVFAGRERLVLGGPPPQTVNQLFVDIATVDFGDLEDPFDDSVRAISGFGDLEPGQLDVDLENGSATLNLSLPANECTFLPDSEPTDCTETTLSVDLDWAAVSDTLRLKEKFHDDFENCRIRAHFKGEVTPAEAVGSITAGGQDYTRATPSDFADIVDSTRGQTVFITDSFEDCFGEPEPVAASRNTKY